MWGTAILLINVVFYSSTSIEDIARWSSTIIAFNTCLTCFVLFDTWHSAFPRSGTYKTNPFVRIYRVPQSSISDIRTFIVVLIEFLLCPYICFGSSFVNLHSAVLNYYGRRWWRVARIVNIFFWKYSSAVRSSLPANSPQCPSGRQPVFFHVEGSGA